METSESNEPTAQDEKAPQREHHETGNPPMLVLKLESDKVRAFAYAFLLHCEFSSHNGEDLIKLDYGFCQIEMAGRKLGGYFKWICLHELKYLPVSEPAEIEKHGQGARTIRVIDEVEA
jgi:hypothetical protein